ncbi:Nucleotidylyl transferase [Glarea lozoyensis ATCC 20868]|uniref:leucine--tRNA ligase n=1 Tax=Glarea lozoyensis (strain ATCC 20868 / MF5171) TaxID=1116229 RepID=S3DU72_GLAL2|nr:Nucleotidylyl transferase [Glarea lozoyensis ATCC 20868]EPE29963.1 Nucleotidylyl transferase [Glarea lozoyensis ATCC 20868]
MLAIRRQGGRSSLPPGRCRLPHQYNEKSSTICLKYGSRSFKTHQPANDSRTTPQSSKQPESGHPLLKKYKITHPAITKYLNWKPSSSPPQSRPTLDLPALDRKWGAVWEKNRGKTIRAENINGDFSQSEFVYNKKGLRYIVPMFPYPSGDLHLGHLRVYTISDVIARYWRLKGYDVIHPIGWDAFGLPAENAAIERGIDPAIWTYQNIEKMKGQLKSMNGEWDWDKELATCDPDFYKHTQTLFLLLHVNGLAYQAKSMVNYDPVDQTVLANEQVDSDGKSWRSGAQVEKRMLKQWFFKISDFRQELLDDLDGLDWPERIKSMQKNWLGKSEGAKIKFGITAFKHKSIPDVEVFTTRPDTLYGVQYLALAATHPLVQTLAAEDTNLQTFLTELPNMPPESKMGYLLPDVRATNPLAFEKATPDATKASLPIYVASYVLSDYGEGAVMGVPGHDTRDHAFWKCNRPDDPVRVVVAAPAQDVPAVPHVPFIQPGQLTSHSGPLAGLSSSKAAQEILRILTKHGRGEAAETWRLRDWLISRQRYWGTPIPIIHCSSCGAVPVPEEDLPVKLPQVSEHWAKGRSGNPLESAHDWINTPCPKCGQAAKRDTDTMDTFVDSSWYYMRYVDVNNETMMINPRIANTHLPVDIYIGGVEHAILHLLYARFISKFLAATELWPFGQLPMIRGEPFQTVLAQGMVHGKTYTDPSTGRFLKSAEVELQKSSPIITATGQAPLVSFQKMSKSKYNGVDPSTCISKYGADATRAHILFQAPVSEVLEWDENKIAGVTRWMRRLYDHLHEWRAEAGFLGLECKFGFTRNTAASGWRFIRSNGEMGMTRVLQDTPQAFGNRFASTPKNYFISFAIDDDKPLSHPGLVEPHQFVESLRLENARKGNHPETGREVLYPLLMDLAKEGNRESKKLWRAVQETIRSTTASYESGHSLNTVVSDLMSLTNAMIDYPGGELGPQDRWIHYHAAMNLVRMMAPICPAFAEECWHLITYVRPGLKHRLWSFAGTSNFRLISPFRETSVFHYPYPTEDGTLEMLTPDTLKCSVQVNGKLRCVVEFDQPESILKGEALEDWVVKGVLDSPEWKDKVGQKVNVREAKKTIVVKGGKLVNFVM